MALDAVFSVTAKIAEHLVAPIGRRLGYFLHYNRNIKDLRNEVEKLVVTRDGVQGSIEAARRNGEVIRPDVMNWLTSVDETVAEARNFLDSDVQANDKCVYCWSRYRLSKEAKRKMVVFTRLQGNGGFDCVSYPPPPPEIESMLDGDFVAFQSTTLAFEEVMKALKVDDIKIIGIYGMGGVGKTTLVKQIGKRAKEEKLFDVVLMAVVSQTPDLKSIQGQIADMLGLKFTEETEQGRAGRLWNTLKQFEPTKRVLIILDDIWARLEPTQIGIPSDVHPKNLKIVLTTRRQQVCQAMGCQRQVALNVLSQQDSWNLFRNNAGGVVDSPTLNGVAREVASECADLPIALVTVGRALRNNENVQEWNEAAHELRNASPTNIEDVDKKVYACIKLSYDYLKSGEAKQIFLFCCLFPEDRNIYVEMLVPYAVGKGLFQNVADNIEEVRNSISKTISNLTASSLLLKSNKEDCIKMHDVLRDVGISIASANENDAFMIRASVDLRQWPNVTFEHYTVISLMYVRIQELPVGLEYPKLKILSLQGIRELTEIPNAFFQGMQSLEVLNLNDKGSLRLPTSIRFLKKLPSVVGKRE